MRCIFNCSGDRKLRRKQIATPSNDPDLGAYEIVNPIEKITVEVESTKLPVIGSREKQEDRQNGLIKDRITSHFKHRDVESKSYSKEKSDEKQKPQHNRGQVHQAHSDSSSLSSLFSYPINDMDKNSSSPGDEPEIDDEHKFAQQESSDSLFSISVNSKKQPGSGEKEVNSPMKVREWPKRGQKIIGLNRSGLSTIENFTRSNANNLGKLITMDDQEDKVDVKKDTVFNKQGLNFMEKDKDVEIIGSNHSAKINSITKPIENFTQQNAGKLGELITMDEQEDKENIKSMPISREDPVLKTIGSNHGVEINSLLNPIENLTRWNTGESRRFILMDDQEENQEKSVPLSCLEPNYKNSSQSSETKEKEVLVDTSLSSWLVESERGRGSPKSVENSPDRQNYPPRRTMRLRA